MNYTDRLMTIPTTIKRPTPLEELKSLEQLFSKYGYRTKTSPSTKLAGVTVLSALDPSKRVCFMSAVDKEGYVERGVRVTIKTAWLQKYLYFIPGRNKYDEEWQSIHKMEFCDEFLVKLDELEEFAHRVCRSRLHSYLCTSIQKFGMHFKDALYMGMQIMQLYHAEDDLKAMMYNFYDRTHN